MPASPSPAQSDAARRNGARSRGPLTPEGRVVSAANGTKHGLFAAGMAMAPEEERLFEEKLAALERQHRPADAAEAHWVEQIAVGMIRQRRLDAIEGLVTGALIAGSTGEPPRALPSIDSLIRYRARLARDHELATRELAAARARREAPEPAASLERPESPAVQAALRELAAFEAGDRHGFVGRGKDEPEPASPPLNRAQRRRLEAKRRQKAA